VEEAELMGPHRVEEGDAVVGLRSSGLHANGFSLVRRGIEGLDLLATPEDLERPLAEELLEPTLIYVDAVLALAGRGLLRAAAHITGGGMVENLPRALPAGLGAEVDLGAWRPHPVFRFVQRTTDASPEEMFRTFNMGIGMAAVVPNGRDGDAIEVAGEHGIEAMRIGTVVPVEGVTFR
jgi:phosphoribosylformylglycinamidine cyclo-ligase